MWIVLVWIISTVCYLPLYFEQLGYPVSNVLIQIKYFFVLIPIIFTLIYIKRKSNIKKWLSSLFVQKVGMEPFVLCGVIALFGVLCTSILGKETINGISLIFNILYLFCMAALEETAWRGFWLESVLQKRTEKTAILIVSLEWAVWHIPMWTIRNSLGMEEIVFWLMYTVVVGTILGKCMMRYKNILVPIILHTIFNVCFLIPIKMGVIVVLFVWAAVHIFYEFYNGKSS